MWFLWFYVKGDKTMDEGIQAISFANSYFALVDGLASGLESHLSKDVVLDWFGRTVRGRKNVSAFMETHKVTSRHRFAHIVPTAGISYEKKNLNREKPYFDDEQINQDRFEIDSNDDQPFSRETEMSRRDVVKDFNQNEINTKGASVMDDVSYDLSNLFKLEISSTNIEEIEQSINRIKLEEEMAPTIRAIKKECGRADERSVVESSTIKYVEADGEIEFFRKFLKKDAWNAYFWSMSSVHTWRRPCKLQIAYTTLTESPILEPPCRSRNIETRFAQPKTRLPSLEEIGEISNRLVPNTNDFGGFLKDVDFFEDRRGFLESLETEMAIKEPCAPLFAPQYVEDRLVFEKPCVDVANCNSKNRKKFVFNYQIHLIIYEGGGKCKANYPHESERTKF